MTELIETRLEEGGILLAVIDMPGRSMNVFSAALMDALEDLIHRTESDASVSGLVVTSGKPAFLAGADLAMIREFTERALTDSAEEMHALCGRLGRLFRRLELIPKPVVAAVNGLALGGGLELAMACHYRIASNDVRAVLGLPEVNLGLLPGAGGTQRLPRLVGVKEGLRMLLSGAPMGPEKALSLGLVDELAEPGAVVEAALAVVRGGKVPRPRWDKANYAPTSTPYDFADPEIVDRIADDLRIPDEQRADYPAYNAILNCVVGGWTLPMTDASDWEMKQFLTLMFDPVAGNMVRSLFLNRQRAEKAFEHIANAPARAIRVEGEGAFADALRAEFEKAARKAGLSEGGETGPVRIIASGHPSPGALALLNERSAPVQGPGLFVGPKTAAGRVVEICVLSADDPGLRDGLVVAKALRATPFVNTGGRPFLPALVAAQDGANAITRTDMLNIIADAAATARDAGGVEDTELADMAAVLAGVVPSFAGGPFTWLAQQGAKSHST